MLPNSQASNTSFARQPLDSTPTRRALAAILQPQPPSKQVAADQPIQFFIRKPTYMMVSIMRPSIMRPSLLRQAARSPAAFAMRTTALHTSSKRCAILPPGPQRIEGGVNDPAPVPTPSAAHGSYHWTIERLIAAGLVPLSIAPFASGSLNPTMDAILCSAVLIHSHMGFQSVVIDYIPKKTYPGLRKLFWWGLNAATLTVGIGLYEFETNDVGVTEAIKRVWKA